MTGWNDLEDLEVYDTKSVTVQGNNVLIVDGLNMAFRWKHSLYNPDKDSNVEDYIRPSEGFIDPYVKTIKSLAKSYNCSKIVLTADWGSSSFRKEIYPEYKANREELKNNQTVVQETAFNCFFEDWQEILELIESEIPGLTLFRFRKVEADDIAAALVNLATIKYETKYDHIWLVSSDKDWDLMVGDSCSRFNWANQKHWKNLDKTGPRPKEITSINWNDHHLGTQEQYLGLRVLEGDQSDNIPGVHLIGPKRGLALIEKHGNIDKLLDACPLPGKAKYIQNLNEQVDRLRKCKILMDFPNQCEEAVGFDNLSLLDTEVSTW